MNIRLPITFLEDRNELDAKLKARQLVREFASYRYGLFKESGFRHDFMYPPFSALAGLRAPAWSPQQPQSSARPNLVHTLSTLVEQVYADQTNETATRGFDPRWQECPFETSPGSGLPSARAQACAPFLSRNSSQAGPVRQPRSFNLMAADPFAYGTPTSTGSGIQPLEYRDLAESVSWHFCGQNFASQASAAGQNDEPASTKPSRAEFVHNQLATNKQNILCHERSALEVIRSSDDFRQTQYR